MHIEMWLEQHDKLANWLSAAGTLIAVMISVVVAITSEFRARNSEIQARLDRSEMRRVTDERRAQELEFAMQRRREQASRIYAFLVNTRGTGFVRYINTSQLPVTNLKLWIARRDGKGELALRPLWNLTPTGGDGLSIDFHRFNRKLAQGPVLEEGVDYFPLALEFTDANGTSWRRAGSRRGVFDLHEIESNEYLALDAEGKVLSPAEPFDGWESLKE